MLEQKLAKLAARWVRLAGLDIKLHNRVRMVDAAVGADMTAEQRTLLAAACDLVDVLAATEEGRKALREVGYEPEQKEHTLAKAETSLTPAAPTAQPSHVELKITTDTTLAFAELASLVGEFQSLTELFFKQIEQGFELVSVDLDAAATPSAGESRVVLKSTDELVLFVSALRALNLETRARIGLPS